MHNKTCHDNPTSRLVSMLSHHYNPNPVIDARRRWQWCMRSSFS
jgi:hypothetical protein